MDEACRAKTIFWIVTCSYIDEKDIIVKDLLNIYNYGAEQRLGGEQKWTQLKKNNVAQGGANNQPTISDNHESPLMREAIH